MYKPYNAHDPRSSFYDNGPTKYALEYIKKKLAFESEDWTHPRLQSVILRNKELQIKLDTRRFYDFVMRSHYQQVSEHFRGKKTDQEQEHAPETYRLMEPTLDSFISDLLATKQRDPRLD